MVKILYIHHGGALGGAPLSLLLLLREVDRSMYDIEVLCTEDGPAAGMFRDAGIPTQIFPLSQVPHTTHFWFRWWGLPGFLKACALVIPDLISLRSFLRRGRYALVHLNESSLVSCALAARSLGIPVVWHVRSILARGYLGVRRAILRGVIRRWGTRVIAISRAVAGALGDNPAVSVIYNGVDLAGLSPALSGGPFRAEFSLAPGDVAIGVLGQILEVKGYGDFVRAASLIAEQRPEVKFFIIGDAGPWPEAIRFRESLRRYAEERGIADRVILTGPRRDIPACLAGLDIVALPSWEEPFGRPVIEAGAMGKPVVASCAGGPAELVEDGVTGLLVPPRDPQALAAALLTLIGDAGRRRTMGAAARARIESLCDVKARAADVFSLYAGLLGP